MSYGKYDIVIMRKAKMIEGSEREISQGFFYIKVCKEKLPVAGFLYEMRWSICLIKVRCPANIPAVRN